MLDASVALMNQYSAISANMGEYVASASASNDSVETTNEINMTSLTHSTTNDNAPSTSMAAKQRNREDSIQIEDLGSDEYDEVRNIQSPETSENVELRRRRLQKFLQTEQSKE